jgi:hypothetical protein
MTFVFLYHVNIVSICEQSKMSSRCCGSIIYVKTVQYWGKDGTLMNPCRYFLGPPTKTLNFLSVRREAISLLRLVKNCDSDNLYSRPECHVVSKAISVSNYSSLTCHAYNTSARTAQETVLLLQCNCCIRVCLVAHVIATQLLPSNDHRLQSN